MPPQDREKAVEDLLQQLTLEEKVALCHANSPFRSNGCHRLGLSDFVFSDGPHGVRAEVKQDWRLDHEADNEVTYFPVGIALGATWNTDLAYKFGQSLGAEARARGKDVILGPGVNIHRTPLNGRNFEYLGEDPTHVADLACAAIRGIQENDVAACIKHYALNNQERDRMFVNVQCDDRTLREIYLPAFERAVKEAHVLTVMGAYNKFRGQHCCQHEVLIQQILKKEWGFTGLLVSDWGGVHDAMEAAQNGLDIEMGGDLKNLYLDKPFLEGLCDGKYPTSVVDDKVRRILSVRLAVHKDQPDRQNGAKNTRAHQQVARRMAEESLVLLQNERQTLPLAGKEIKTLAVIGENATIQHAQGGGSSGIHPLYEVTPLEGLQELLGDRVKIIFAKGYPSLPKNFSAIPTSCLEAPDVAGIGGWRKESYATRSPSGDPVKVETVPDISFPTGSPTPLNREFGQWSVVWRGKIRLPREETVEWIVNGWDNWFLRMDGEPLASVWDLTAPGFKKVKCHLEANRTYELSLTFTPKNKDSNLRFGWCRDAENNSTQDTGESDERKEALSAARQADAVLFFGGTTHMQDVEGSDRESYDLPYQQNELLADLAEANPNLTAVLFGGSPVRIPWKNKVPAILQAWYPGSEGGRALADVIFGRVSPSGKLPFSWPAELKDFAAHALNAYQGQEADYREGLFTGYRWHDSPDRPKPLFPFGHGLSYTRFALRDAGFKTATDDKILGHAEVTVENTGDCAGAEVVQLYLRPNNPAVPRPVKELKNFAKVYLEPKQSKTIALPLRHRDFCYWCDKSHAWTRDNGAFTLLIGTSSQDCPITLDLNLPEPG